MQINQIQTQPQNVHHALIKNFNINDAFSNPLFPDSQNTIDIFIKKLKSFERHQEAQSLAKTFENLKIIHRRINEIKLAIKRHPGKPETDALLFELSELKRIKFKFDRYHNINNQEFKDEIQSLLELHEKVLLERKKLVSPNIDTHPKTNVYLPIPKDILKALNNPLNGRDAINKLSKKLEQSEYENSDQMRHWIDIYYLRYNLAIASPEKTAALNALANPLDKNSIRNINIWTRKLKEAELYTDANSILLLFEEETKNQIFKLARIKKKTILEKVMDCIGCINDRIRDRIADRRMNRRINKIFE